MRIFMKSWKENGNWIVIGKKKSKLERHEIKSFLSFLIFKNIVTLLLAKYLYILDIVVKLQEMMDVWGNTMDHKKSDCLKLN